MSLPTEPRQPHQPDMGRKRTVKEHELELAKKLGGKRQIASGAIDGYKGDVKLDDFLLDSKETDGDEIRVDRTMIMKISREALGNNREPGLVLTWNKLAVGIPKEWVVIPIDVFMKLLKGSQ